MYGGRGACVCGVRKVLLGICLWPANQILFRLLLILNRFVEDSEKQAAGFFIYSRAMGYWTHIQTVKLPRELQGNGNMGAEFPFLFMYLVSNSSVDFV